MKPKNSYSRYDTMIALNYAGYIVKPILSMDTCRSGVLVLRRQQGVLAILHNCITRWRRKALVRTFAKYNADLLFAIPTK